MWESILIWAIIGGCAVVVLRRFYRQLHSAINSNKTSRCDCACSGCHTASCHAQQETILRKLKARR
ncbi:MAG: hypothetical protein ACK5PS_14835 [Desulfopila sp.]